MPHQLFGADRQVIEEAWPGDVIGLFDTGTLRIGDTLCEGTAFEYAELPRFSPEIFARVRARDALKRKQFEKGLEQLSQEGAIQIFHARGGGMRDPIVGAVGALQLEVLEYRLLHEYGADLGMDRLPYQVARLGGRRGIRRGAFRGGGGRALRRGPRPQPHRTVQERMEPELRDGPAPRLDLVAHRSRRSAVET